MAQETHPDEPISKPDKPASLSEQSPAISKSQLKKLRRHQRWLENKPIRKKAEKEKRRQRRIAVAKQRDQDDQAGVKKPSKTLMRDSSNRFKIVIDLDFDQYMTPSEISKCVKQVRCIYANNRRAQNPFQLYLSSLRGRILDQFAKSSKGYENWDVNHSDIDYLDLLDQDGKPFDKGKFIYLTGDSDQVLPDVDNLLSNYESNIFVIGGLVDHNRHKKLCYDLAQAKGIITARLPISEHIQLSQRHILSTVTVFDILMEALGSRKPWKDALLAAVPKRKIAETGVAGV